jgi:IgGFc binding protein
VTLDEGEALTLASSVGDLSGTFIESWNTFAVFAHHEAGIEEQMLPLVGWGTEFAASAAVRADEQAEDQVLWRMLASQDETMLEFDAECSDWAVDSAALNTGQIFDVTLPSSCRFWVSANFPVFIVQIALPRIGSASDPAMIALRAVNQWSERYVLPSSPPAAIETALLVRPAGIEVSWNGIAPSGVWLSVGTGDWQSLATAVTSGILEIFFDHPSLTVSVLGTTGDATYGYVPAYNSTYFPDTP